LRQAVITIGAIENQLRRGRSFVATWQHGCREQRRNGFGGQAGFVTAGEFDVFVANQLVEINRAALIVGRNCDQIPHRPRINFGSEEAGRLIRRQTDIAIRHRTGRAIHK